MDLNGFLIGFKSGLRVCALLGEVRLVCVVAMRLAEYSMFIISYERFSKLYFKIYIYIYINMTLIKITLIAFLF